MREKLFLLLIIIFGVAIRLVNLHQPPVEWFPTRQVMDLDIIRSFYLNETTFLRPVVHNFARPGYLLQEFPLLWWGIAQLMKLAGEFSTSLARLGIIAFYPLLSIAIYKFQSLFFSDKLSRLLPVALLAVLPLSIIQSRSIQPEYPMITMMVWAFVLWVRYLKNSKARNVVLSSILSVGSVLMKLTNVYLLAPMAVAVLINRKNQSKYIWVTFLTLAMITIFSLYIWWFMVISPVRATTPSSFDAVWRKDYLLSIFLIYSRDYLFWKGLLDNLVVATATNIGVLLFLLSLFYLIIDFRKKSTKAKIYSSLILSWGLSVGLMLVIMSGNSLQEYYFTSLLPPVTLGISYSIYKITLNLNNRWWRYPTVFFLLILISWRSYLFVQPKLALELDKQSLLINEVKGLVPKDDSLVLISNVSPPLHGFYLDRWTIPINFLPAQMTKRDLAEYKYLSSGDNWINKSPEVQLTELMAKNYRYLVVTDLETFKNEKELKRHVLNSYCLLWTDERGYIFELLPCI
ncbi:glycosyltransferase family 39 protein [Candidatus Collierbacteria bacterium]|nr:glycosyltransferase family 39 protein [Candidatus Collierbacteria bacterium]